MGETSLIEIGLALLTILCGLIGWLLDNKDQKQAALIQALFTKHDEDAAKLVALELEIARKYYIKDELDHRFDKLERAFTDGFNDMGRRFDNLSGELIKYLHNNGNDNHNGRNQ